MWNILKKYKIKKEHKKMLAEQKIRNLKLEIKQIEEKCSSITNEQNKNKWILDKESNAKCPICKSKNVVDSIKRIQGKINGSFEGSSWNALTFGSSYSSGRINGEIDTNEVNKCNDCQHEWKKCKSDHIWSIDF